MGLMIDFRDHERFCELSALAVKGEISPAEHGALMAHLERCVECRQKHENLIEFAATILPLAAAERCEAAEKKIVTLPIAGDDVPDNFDPAFQFDPALRLPSQKTPVAFDSKPQSPEELIRRAQVAAGHGVILRPIYVFVAAACLLLVASGVGYQMWRLSVSSRVQKEKIGQLGNEIGELGQQVSDLNAGRNAAVTNLQEQLTQSHSENAELAQRGAALQQKLDGASSQVQSLLAAVSSGKEREASLTQRLHDEEAKLSQMNEELKSARNQPPPVVASDTSREKAKLEALEGKLLAETEAVDREKRLLAADKDIRDLMGARNLHIIDVFEVDGKGRTEKSFGRVFFTEGKSLIFYAFDLGNKRATTTNASFQVWGAQESSDSSAQSLGIFFEDDKTDHRWVLKFDNPVVLAEINQVFVTVEPPGGSKKPTGRKMLYAYLNSHLNHP